MLSANARQRRVVISGVGIVSPIGTTPETFWQSLMDGRSGVGALHSDRSNAAACAGEVKDFGGKIDDFGTLDNEVKRKIRKSLKLMNRETQMAVAATQHALTDSGLASGEIDPDRIGICFGTGNVSMLPEDFLAGIEACTTQGDDFDFRQWGTDGLPQIAPVWLLKCLPNMPACHIAMYNDFRGPNNSITQREAAANIAVAEACSNILDGVADAMLVGGAGTTILPFNRLHTAIEQELASGGGDPAAACRPFDSHRNGAVLGEGAAALVLEDYTLAVRRGASIYGEVLGAGSSCVVDREHAPRCRKALSNAMQAALRVAGLTPAEIDHIHAHGLSTRQADIDEAQAICDIFGERAKCIPLVAAKSQMGNAGAGGGAIELVASLLALRNGTLFPTRNYERPDPQCPVRPVVLQGVEAGRTFLNLSLVTQGQASCVLVRAVA